MLGVAGAGSGVSWWIVVGSPRTDPFALAVDGLLVIVAVAYGVGTGRARRAGWPEVQGRGRWTPVIFASFLGGLLALFAALGSGLAQYQRAQPSVAVAQHVLLMMVAPPLLVLGRPAEAWTGLVGRGRARRATLDETRHRGPSGPGTRPRRPGSAAPVCAAVLGRARGVSSWALYYGSMGAFFLTAAFAASLRDPVLLDGTQVGFLAVGALFWWGLTSPPRGPGVAPGEHRCYAFRIGAVAGGMPIETAVGLALVLWPRPLAPGETLVATHSAGLLLWLASMLTSGVALAVILVQWCIDDSRRMDAYDGAWEPAMDARRGPAGLPVGVLSLTPEAPGSQASGGGVVRSRP